MLSLIWYLDTNQLEIYHLKSWDPAILQPQSPQYPSSQNCILTLNRQGLSLAPFINQSYQCNFTFHIVRYCRRWELPLLLANLMVDQLQKLVSFGINVLRWEFKDLKSLKLYIFQNFEFVLSDYDVKNLLAFEKFVLDWLFEFFLAFIKLHDFISFAKQIDPFLNQQRVCFIFSFNDVTRPSKT